MDLPQGEGQSQPREDETNPDLGGFSQVLASLSCVPFLSIDYGNGGHVDDVSDLDATLQYVDRFLHAQQYGTDRFSVCEAPDQLVGDIGGAEVGKNQYIGRPGEIAPGVGLVEHRLQNGDVGLDLPIHLEVGDSVP